MKLGKITKLLLVAAMLLPLSAWAEVSTVPEPVSVTESVAGKNPGDSAGSTEGKAGTAPVLKQDGALPQAETGLPVSVPAGGSVSVPAGESVPVPAGGSVSEERTGSGPVSDAKDLDGEEVIEEGIADPLEPWNRWMFTFNDKLYFWAMKPVAQGYNAVVAEPVRVSVRNFFNNVAMPVRFVNSLLQLKFVSAGTELARFGLNTTVGIAGFLDVAKDNFDLSGQKEDFGQTLGRYGIGGGVYIVWPFIGPSNIRDTIGFVGDSFLNPISYIDPIEAVIGIDAYDRINRTSLELGDYEALKESSLEPYTAVKDAYMQYRKNLIKK
jgi:phospholipid-binding lipoprotein MlaA